MRPSVAPFFEFLGHGRSAIMVVAIAVMYFSSSFRRKFESTPLHRRIVTTITAAVWDQGNDNGITGQTGTFAHIYLKERNKVRRTHQIRRWFSKGGRNDESYDVKCMMMSHGDFSSGAK